ncbi:MAG: acyltransferase [Proteobacteria bacterium]|nr:acyltransferase [Pseudomonadota bacterium]
MTQAPARLYGLDAMRGIAAVCVLVLHVHAIYGGFPDMFGKAYLAVDFFFMLSGYLMARTYGARLAGGMGGMRFFRIRYRRLWPTMAMGGLIGAGYLWAATQDPRLFALIFAANILLIPVSYQQELFPLNVPAWSVFYELVVNAIHGLFLARLSAAWLALIAGLSLLATALLSARFGTLDLGARPATLLPGLPRALLSYTVGMLLWQAWRDRPPVPISPLLAALGFPALIVLPWLIGIDHWAYDLAFVLGACPLLLAGGLAVQRPSMLAMWLGQGSFPLYAVHFAVLRQAQLLGFGAVGGLCLALAAAALVTIWTMRRASHSPTDKPRALPYPGAAKEGHR